MAWTRFEKLKALVSKRGVGFWAVSIAVLFAISQIAYVRSRSVEGYTGFGLWLGALGSFVAAGAALWISVSNRRRSIKGRLANVRFPEMRQEVIEQLGALADRDYQQRVWIERIYPHDKFYDDLTMTINILYDIALPDPERWMGAVLMSKREVDELAGLEEVLGPLIDDLRNASDQTYISDPRWSEVVSAARSALSAMTTAPEQLK